MASKSGGSLGRGQLEAIPSQEAKLSSAPGRPRARVCGCRAPADEPRVPRWQPRVCGPGTGRPLLGGFPWGLKLDGIRPGLPAARRSGHPGLRAMGVNQASQGFRAPPRSPWWAVGGGGDLAGGSAPVSLALRRSFKDQGGREAERRCPMNVSMWLSSLRGPTPRHP